MLIMAPKLHITSQKDSKIPDHLAVVFTILRVPHLINLLQYIIIIVKNNIFSINYPVAFFLQAHQQ